MSINVEKLKLNILGEGKHGATMDELRAVKIPAATDSYTPLPHATLIEMVHENLRLQGFDLIGETFSLARGGNHSFAVMQVHRNDIGGNEGVGKVIHLRNSYDKTLAAQMGVGSAPVICTNLCLFSSDRLAKRHTSGIMDSIYTAISNKLIATVAEWRAQEALEDAWRQIRLSQREADHLILQAARANALPKSKILDVAEQFASPLHDFGGPTLYTLFQGFTEVYKRVSPLALADNSAQLVRVLDAAAHRDPLDVVEIEGWRD